MPNIKSNTYQKRMWSYVPSKEEMQKVGWCLNNGIRISPLGIKDDYMNFFIEIEINGKTHKSPSTFSVDDLSKTIYGYYFDYYNKYKDSLEWWNNLSDDNKSIYESPTLTRIKKWHEDVVA